MTNFTYVPLSDDLIGGLSPAAVTMIGADPNYPASRIQSIEMSDVARGAHPTKIRIDLGTNRQVKFWAALNMNNSAAGAPIVRSFNDSGYATPSGDLLTLGPRLNDAKGYSAAMNSRRYWEVDLSSCSPSDSFMEVGKLVAALDVRTFSQNFSNFGHAIGYSNQYAQTPGGTAYVICLEPRREILSISWNASLVNPAVAEVIALLDRTRGGAYPFLVIPDNDQAEFYYVRAADQLSNWSEAFKRAYLQGLTLNLKELSRGRIQVQGT